MIAQHRKNKNIPLAIKAFDELIRITKGHNYLSLMVIGNEGPETAAIKSLIEQRSLETSIEMIDGVTDGQLRWLYTNCEFLMAPSSIEGFGLPIAEGLFCGCRIVCSDIPAFREIGGDACHYFDLHAEAGPSAVVQAISKALREPAMPAKQLDRYVMENVAREYAALYMHLIKDRGER
jgi:glycosyltransferase involved in cell wall biosynthesis